MTSMPRRRVWHEWTCDNCRQCVETDDTKLSDGSYEKRMPPKWTRGWQDWAHWCADCVEAVESTLAARVEQNETEV